jgi:hypothetical protein
LNGVPREGEDGISAAGRATGSIEGFPYESGLLSESLVTQHAKDRLSKTVCRRFLSGKADTRPEPFHLLANERLLATWGTTISGTPLYRVSLTLFIPPCDTNTPKHAAAR